MMKNFSKIFLLGVFIALLYTCSKDDTPEPTPKVTYTITSTISPANGGTISPESGSYEKGETVTFTATANTNFVFKNWSGGATGTDNPITVTINSDKAITAVFEEQAPVYKNGEGEIGTLGGTVMIEDVNSPLNGVKIEIPEGALEAKKNIKISLPAEDIKFSLDETLQLIKFEPEGLTFLKDVEISLPYTDKMKDTSNIYIINYVREPEGISKLTKKSIDINQKIVTSYTNHFSLFAAWDDNVRAEIKMLNLDGKIAAKVYMIGDNTNVGLKWIRNGWAHNLTDANVWQCIQNDSHNSVVSSFNVSLFENVSFGIDKSIDNIKIDIIREDWYNSGKYYVRVINKTTGNEIFETESLDNEDLLDSPNSIAAWMSGKSIVFKFDPNFIPNEDKKYYILFNWSVSNGQNNYFTPIYQESNKKNRKKISEIKDFVPDLNNNYINDAYEPDPPSVETLEPDDIKETEATLKGQVINNGGASISEKGFYYATHSNPTENDEKVIVSGSNVGTFEKTVILESNYNYHYRAFATNSAGTQVGEAIHFKTLNAGPNIQFFEPAENAAFQKGEKVTIKAAADDTDGTIVNVKFLVDDTLIKEFTSPQATYSSEWDSSSATEGVHEIKITATDSDNKSTSAKRSIQIKDGNLAVTLPTASSVWKMGDQNVVINWNTGNLGGNVAIELHKGTNKLGTLTSSAPNNGSYKEYDVQTTLAEGNDYRIKIISVEYPAKEVFSDYFTINKATNLSPDEPKDEFPENGVSIELTSETLFWTCSDPEEDTLIYDVYFGPTQTPPLVSEGQDKNTYDVTNLIQGQTYYWYVVANDGNGNTTKGSTWSFSLGGQTTLPTVTTVAPTNIITTSATIGGNVTSDGGASVTERGFYWSTLANSESTGTKLIKGNGIGTYSEDLTTLTPNTTYYTKAYAINTKGIAYGNEITFKTLQENNNSTSVFSQYSFDSNYLDNSSNSNDFNLSGNISYVTDRFGNSENALYINGDGSYLSSNFVMQDNWSLSFWHNPQLISDNDQFLLLGDYTTNNDIHLKYTSNQLFVNLVGISSNAVSDISTNKWYHIVLTSDGSSIKVFQDNVLIKTINETPNFNFSGSKLKIGSRNGNQASSLYIDDLKIYNGELTNNEIQNLYSDNSWSGNNIIDNDGDGVNDDIDQCTDTPNGTAVDNKGCPINLINQVQFKGETYDLAWGEIKYEGISDDNPDGKHAFYLSLFPSHIVNDPINGINGEGFIIEVEPFFTDSPNPVGTFHEDFADLYYDGYNFVNGESIDGGTEGNYINSNLTLIINKTNDEYEITIEGNDENMNELRAHYKGTLIERTSIYRPDISTKNAESITDISAAIKGQIYNSGGSPITEMGFYWGTTENSDLTGTKIVVENSIGEYSTLLSGLSPQTTYFFKAFATNEIGTSYGDENSFTTTESVSSSDILFNPDLTYGSVSDIDGNAYKTIVIGTQTWMAENLKTTKYRDGTTIPNITSYSEWDNLSTGAYSNYNNDASKVATYGRLYNWYAVNNAKGLCPQNWHVPSDAEWTTLTNYLGGLSDAGGKLKETGFSHWLEFNIGATNSSGFTGLPSGVRTSGSNGSFTDLNRYAYFWTSTKTSTYGNIFAWYRKLYDIQGEIYSSSWNQKIGLCIRCVKD